VDVPYNGNPEHVRLAPDAREAIDALRAAGVRLGVISNQSGVARGLITREQVESVNARVEELLGPFEVWEYCPHGPDDGCDCRKPHPGMVLRAARRLDVSPEEIVVLGDTDADVQAAEAAGSRGIRIGDGLTLREAVSQIVS